METKDNKNVVNKTTYNILMRKTKTQLIDIILRKDAIERNLRSDMAGTIKSFEELKTAFNNVKDDCQSLIAANQKLNINCKDLQTKYLDYKEESEDKYSKAIKVVWFLLIIFIISGILNIFLLLF